MIFEKSENESSEKKAVVVPQDKDFRIIGLYGDIEEEKSEITVYNLLHLYETRHKNVPIDLTDEQNEQLEKALTEGGNVDFDITKTVVQPVEMVLCTSGGSALDMFAIYDVMRMVREECDLVTYGIGKVMSAGVLLLAAGTKGKRKIGKHCRVMIHSVQAGTRGSMHEVNNELKEIAFTEEQYVKILSAETNMSEKQIRKMMDKNLNIYLSAEEAVKYGIADIIV